MATIYTVKDGETISDVVLNATGSINNLDSILTANNFTEWVPTLTTGQTIIIPTTVVIQPNVLRDLAIYPANNRMENSTLNVQINDFISILAELNGKTFEDSQVFDFEDNIIYEFENL